LAAHRAKQAALEAQLASVLAKQGEMNARQGGDACNIRWDEFWLKAASGHSSR
jgi:hypothetical protein